MSPYKSYCICISLKVCSNGGREVRQKEVNKFSSLLWIAMKPSLDDSNLVLKWYFVGFCMYCDSSLG